MEEQISIENLIKALPLNQRVPVVALKKYFDQRTDLDQEQEQQLQVIRNKYAAKVKPLLDRASQLIQGSAPTPEEVTLLPNYLKPGEKIGNLKGKVIESYWNGAFQNSALQQKISEQDQHALEYLLNIQVVNDPEDPTSLNFKFTFKTNPYFEAGSFIRRLRFMDNSPISIEGDLLTYKPGIWLTHEVRKVKSKTSGETKLMMGKKKQSFFDIFLNWTAVDNPHELQKCTKIFDELDHVVRQSFDYFLGLYEMDQSVDEQDYEQDDVSEQSNPKGRKK